MSDTLPQAQHATKFLVYINGVRVPAISVNVGTGIFSPVNGTIEMAPHRLLSRIGAEDRLQVAVFYLDSWYYDTEPQWALLFEAEVTGWSYVNQGSSRSLTLNVASHLTILAQLFFFFMSGEAPTTGSLAKPDHDYPNQLNIKSKYPGAFFTEGTHKSPIARPFDIIENIVKAVVGEYKGDQKPLAPGEKDIQAEIDRLRLLADRQMELDVERMSDRAARTKLGDADITQESLARAKSEAAADIRASLEEQARKRLLGTIEEYATKATGATPPDATLIDLQTKAYRLQAADTLRFRSGTSKSITHTGFYARHFRLIRFLEHWMASPFIEGRPGYEDPVDGKLGGGVFPLLRATNAKKMFKALVSQSGAKFGEGGSLWNFLQGLFGTLYYEIVEVMAPPSHTLDKFGLPYGPFRAVEDADPAQWADNLAKGKNRLGIGSFLTKPQTTFALPPACNTYFPSMWTNLQLTEDYSNSPTRAYFNRSSAVKKLTAGSKLTGYAAAATGVGFPAVVDGHIDRASQTASSDQEFLIFPEEYYAGPKPFITELPFMFTELQKVANSARFTLDEETLTLRRNLGELQKDSPQWGETVNEDMRASEKRAKKGHGTHALLYMLAENAFYKQKYLNRQGQLTGGFNPYAIAGFPMAIFDNNQSGMHLLATAMQVNHTLTKDGFTTSIPFAYARTFEDMFDQLKADGAYLDMAPHEPVGELQDIFQYMPSANLFYSILLRRNEVAELGALMENSATGKSTDPVTNAKIAGEFKGNGVMDYRMLVRWVLSAGEEDRIVTRSLLASETTLPGFADLDAGYVPNVKLNTAIAPKEVTKAFFDNNDAAMSYVARPVCTLEDYIDFYAVAGRGTSNLDPVGRGRGVRAGIREDHGVPRYYNVIRQFIGGPGVEPGAKVVDEMRLTVIGEEGEEKEAIIVPKNSVATFAHLPDSRKDWQALLIDYTAEIETLLPQGGHTTDPDVLARRGV